MTSIGVFGGTFAPIHHGHLRLAIELRDRLRLDTVHVVPSGTPPHRDSPGIDAQRRFEWVQLAVAGEPGLVADDRELRREGRSYTVDTLADLRSAFPSASIVLLLGDDAANQFHHWRRWREIADLAHLVFVERPGLPPEPAPELVALLRGRRVNSVDALHARPAGSWMPASVPPLAISSTRVRGLLRAGRSVRGLVPQAVIDSFTTEDLRLLTAHEEPALD
jgi:nicotinate-nucleotide adenylyltransferase